MFYFVRWKLEFIYLNALQTERKRRENYSLRKSSQNWNEDSGFPWPTIANHIDDQSAISDARL